MQPGTRIYLKRECQNWTQYQIPLTIVAQTKTVQGMTYIGTTDEGESIFCWASDYFAGKKERAVKKTPWKGIIMLHSHYAETLYRNGNLLERS